MILSSFLYIFIHQSYYNINPYASDSINSDDSLNLASQALYFTSSSNTVYISNIRTIVEFCSNTYNLAYHFI